MRAKKKPLQTSIAIFRKSYPHEKIDKVLFRKNLVVTRIPLIRFSKVHEYETTLREYLKFQLALTERGEVNSENHKKIISQSPVKVIWLFTSQQAVYRFMEVVNKWICMKLKEEYSISKHRKFLQNVFSGLKLKNRVILAAVGKSTESLLKTFGLKVDYLADENEKSSVGSEPRFVGQQAVFELLKKSFTRQTDTFIHVVHPCAKKIDNYLAKNLKAKVPNICYRPLPLYETNSVKISETTIKKLWHTNYWFITSPSIVNSLVSSLFTGLRGAGEAIEYEKMPRLLVIGKTSQRALKNMLQRVRTKKYQAIVKDLIKNAKMLNGNFGEDTATRIIKTIRSK